MNKTVGSAIREARKSRRMSAEKLGELLDPPVSHVAVCAWETGKNNPNVRTVMQIGDILGVDASSLLNGDVAGAHCAASADRDDFRELRECFCKMSKDQRAAVLTVVESMVS